MSRRTPVLTPDLVTRPRVNLDEPIDPSVSRAIDVLEAPFLSDSSGTGSGSGAEPRFPGAGAAPEPGKRGSRSAPEPAPGAAAVDEMLLDAGIEPRRRRSRSRVALTVRVDEDLYSRIRTAAFLHEVSIGDLFIASMTSLLEAEGERRAQG